MTEQPGRLRPSTAGPRGGKKTVTKCGLIPKTFALHYDEVRALRKAADERRSTGTDIVWGALRRYLEIED